MRFYLAIVLFVFTVSSVLSFPGEGSQTVKLNRTSLIDNAIPADSLGPLRAGVLAVRDTIDLGGRPCALPDNILLDISNGHIKNGELIGHNTRLKCRDGAFNRVRISGDWNVSIIRSSFFSDITYENALCDIVALSNKAVSNKILIEEGEYLVSVNKPWHSCVVLNSNTEFVLNGVIKLCPNDLQGCNILCLTGENIRIKGKGKIFGDKDVHTGTGGEWGMGINVQNAHNIKISNITVESCWGDCIYVGKADNVIINNCLLKNARRQGISITSGTNIKVQNCVISDIKGTAPEFAIDVEPNRNNHCSNILIRNVTMRDCQGGVLIYGGAKEASVNSVKIRLCTLERIVKSPFRFDNAENISVENCKVLDFGKKDPFTLINLRDFKKNNIVVSGF